MTKTIKKIAYSMLSIILGFICIFHGFSSPVSAYAADVEVVDFENTNVLDDLQSSSDFVLKDYLPSSPGEHTPGVINVSEYCYSNIDVERENYGVYVYFYNPDLLDINETSSMNKITLAISYKTDPNGFEVGNDYEKFGLKFCGKSTGDTANLFYKFKIIDHFSADGKCIETRVKAEERRYDITEIEIHVNGDDTATAFGVGYSFYFSGYAKDFGLNKGESTLTCRTQKIETVQLDVHNTYWRSESSAEGVFHQNQINSVYFAVDNYFLETYGRLQKIKAEWYEFETKDIFVMNTAESDDPDIADIPQRAFDFFYNHLAGYYPETMGSVYIDPNDTAKENVYGITSQFQDINIFDDVSVTIDWGINGSGRKVNFTDAINYMYWLFATTSDIDEYDPFADETSNGGISSTAFYDYMKSYDLSYDSGYLPVKNNTISADLFEQDIADFRKVNNNSGIVQSGFDGKSSYNFDAEIDISSFRSWSESNPSFATKWKYYGLWSALWGTGMPTDSGRTVTPIEMVSYTDIANKAAADISYEYMIAYNDVAHFTSFIQESEANDKQVVLFRFAQTDYYSEPGYLIKYPTVAEQADGDNYINVYENAVYRAKQTVFFDFDIISLTFYDGENMTVIGVVSNPVDIINPVTPPTYIPEHNQMSGLFMLLAIIVLVILLIILMPVLPYIFKAIWFVITLPFKFIGWIIRSIKDKSGGDKPGGENL